MLHDHTPWNTPFGTTPPDKFSPRRRDLKTHNTHTTDIHVPAELEPAVTANEGPQTHALNRAAAGVGSRVYYP
jgi:hypothetical protein